MNWLAGCSALLVASTVQAQQGSAPAEVDEIVVTANKRVQNLQDVAASVSALGEAALQSIGRQDLTALAGQVPGLQVNQYSPTITIFNIRGVSQNDFADSQEAPIAFYADEVYVSGLGAISGQNFDLERVEILRGPQGTLFGRNATGGLVQIVSARPTRETAGYVTLTGGAYGQFASEGAISGPITRRLRARLSFATNTHDGYIDNRIGADIGNARFSGVRGQIAADVGADGVFTLKLQRLRNDRERSGGLYSWGAAAPDADGLGRPLPRTEDFFGTGPGADPFGYLEPDDDPFTGSYDRIGFFNRTVSSATARYEDRLSFGTLTLIGDYQELRKRYGEDTDMGPFPIFNYDTRQKLHQYSGELRLNGETGRLTWLLGAYGLHITSRNLYRIISPGGILPQQDYGGRLTTDGWAVFGQGEYRLGDAWTLVLGARFSSDIKTLRYTHLTDGALDFVFNPAADPSLARQRFDDWSGTAQLQWAPRDGVLVYAGVNRGTKAGGFGTQAFTPIDPATLPFEGETLVSYEAGFKTTLLDRRLNLNGAGFHYDYDGYQAFATINLSQFITNNPASITGFELEAVARPVPGLTAQAFATYLDTQVEGISLPSGRRVDRVLPQAPEWSAGGLVRYEFGAGPGRIAAQTDWKYDDLQFFSTFNSGVDREGSRVIGNARLSYAVGRVEAAVFVNNLTDRWYRIYNLDLAAALGVTNQAFARPRWVGGSVSYRIR